MLELWGMRSTHSFPSILSPLWSGVVASDRILSMAQIELKLITWKRIVLIIKLRTYPIYQPPPLGQDMTQGQFFKRSLTVLNSEFSFSQTSCLTNAEEPSLFYYLPIGGGRIIGFIPFPRVLVLCEMQPVSSRIWTRVAVSNSWVVSVLPYLSNARWIFHSNCSFLSALWVNVFCHIAFRAFYSRPGFELELPCPFPTTITITPLRTYAKLNCLKWNYFCMLNWIVWNRTDYLYKNGFGIK